MAENGLSQIQSSVSGALSPTTFDSALPDIASLPSDTKISIGAHYVKILIFALLFILSLPALLFFSALALLVARLFSVPLTSSSSPYESGKTRR